MIDHLVASYGLKDSYASFEAVDVPVLDISQDMAKLSSALTEKALKAVTVDHAGAIILGCTGFLGCADAIHSELVAQGIKVPVIDPIPLVLHVADALVKISISHSKTTYPMPNNKGIAGYNIPGFTV